MAYEMPFDVSGERCGFRFKFQSTALAKNSLSGGVSLGKSLDRMELGDGHKSHFLRNGPADSAEIFCD